MINGTDKPSNWPSLTPHQKLAWRRKHGTNPTGFVGVKMESSGKFTASIFDPDQDKKIHLGTFVTPEIAGKAFDDAFARIHGPDPGEEADEEEDELRELVNQHYPPHHPMPFELSEMIRTEILPLLKDDP